MLTCWGCRKALHVNRKKKHAWDEKAHSWWLFRVLPTIRCLTLKGLRMSILQTCHSHAWQEAAGQLFASSAGWVMPNIPGWGHTWQDPTLGHLADSWEMELNHSRSARSGGMKRLHSTVKGWACIEMAWGQGLWVGLERNRKSHISAGTSERISWAGCSRPDRWSWASAGLESQETAFPVVGN